MKILGLHFGHDAGVSLVIDGMFVSHWEKERHVRSRHALGLTGRDIAAALASMDLALDDIDMVATSTSQGIPLLLYDGMEIEFRPSKVVSREALDRLVRHSPGWFARHKKMPTIEWFHFMKNLEEPPEREIEVMEHLFPTLVLDEKRATFSGLALSRRIPVVDPRAHALELTLTIEGRRLPGLHVSHHLCHAAYAYSQLGRGNALILTFDGLSSRGFGGGGLYFGQDRQVAPVFPHHFYFGYFYNDLARRMGLGPVGGAGKLMGLAAWGEPVHYDPRMIGSYSDVQGYFEGCKGMQAHLERWASVADFALQPFDLRECEIPPRAAADIAASAQAMFVDSVLEIAGTADRIAAKAGFSYDTVVLSGGCALNCPSNSAIFSRLGKQVFVPPAVNDEGVSAGAALCCAALQGEVASRPPEGPAEIAYKGPIHRVEPGLLEEHSGFDKIAVEDAAAFLAGKLAEGAIVALFEGRAEIGPRALGHRSILASPLLIDNWRRVNQVKNRERWRPLAPVVLDTEFDRHFEGCPRDSYYMLFNAKVRGPHLPAVTHRDGTARVQVALPESGFIYRVLQAFRDATGVGVLLNTSFNDRGQPIVETPADALRAFDAMGLDYLYLQGLLLARKAKKSARRGSGAAALA